MPLFKKKKNVIDLTILQKRGILKKQEEKTSEPKSKSSDAFGFLDSLASSSSDESKTSIDSSEISHLKVKIGDFEYKLDRLLERLVILEDKIKGFKKD